MPKVATKWEVTCDGCGMKIGEEVKGHEVSGYELKMVSDGSVLYFCDVNCLYKWIMNLGNG
jgi:hypothetical protein